MNATPEWLLDTNTVSYLIRGHPPGVRTLDQMIAAHALALDFTLVSNDRAFERVDGLRLENWATEQK